MDRCALAKEYHEKGYNCAQAVVAAFGDLTGLPERQALAVSGGLGGGLGGSHQEVCGALSGAAMVLSLLHPHLQENEPATKTALYRMVRDFQQRFAAHYGHSRCMDLLQAKVQPDSRSAALGVTQHCTILVVETVELLEEMLREEA